MEKEKVLTRFEILKEREELQRENRKKFRKIMDENELTKKLIRNKEYEIFKDNYTVVRYLTLDQAKELEEGLKEFNERYTKFKQLKDFEQRLITEIGKENVFGVIFWGLNKPTLSFIYKGKRIEAYDEKEAKEEMEKINSFLKVVENLEGYQEINDYEFMYLGVKMQYAGLETKEDLLKRYEEQIQAKKDREIREAKLEELKKEGFVIISHKHFIEYNGIYLGGKYWYEIETSAKEEKERLINMYQEKENEAKKVAEFIEQNIQDGLKVHIEHQIIVFGEIYKRFLNFSLSVKIYYKRKLIEELEHAPKTMIEKLKEGGYLK